jgi:hypothetical protein
MGDAIIRDYYPQVICFATVRSHDTDKELSNIAFHLLTVSWSQVYVIESFQTL